MNAANNNTMMDLICKFLAGEASAEEAMQLEDWLANPEHAARFKRIAALWNQLPGAATPQIPATQQAWSELKAILPSGRKPAMVRLLLNRYVAASVIGLLIFLSIIWLSRSHQQQPGPTDTLSYITQTTTHAVKTATMPDGTTITLNRNSSVTYTNRFHKQDRAVELTGECYFQVVPDQQFPFMISTGELTIKVVGTSFNVRNNTPAGNIEVQVQSGVVKMYTMAKEITVQKGQTGVYNINSQELLLTDTLDINSLSYATKTFSFNDIAFADACRYLENAFQVTIRLDQRQFAGCRLSAQFDNKPLDYILHVIDATLNTTHQQEGNTIQIKGNGCR